MRQVNMWCVAALIGMGVLAGWQAWSRAQQPASRSQPDAALASRLEFEVVESYDAKYLGDTPGHIGRAGLLESRRPRVALNDPIYRGEELVGRVTGLVWNRTSGRLDIEFDPANQVRVFVGDRVWMALDSTAAAPTAASPQPQ